MGKVKPLKPLKPLAEIDCLWGKQHGYVLTQAGAFNRALLEMQLETLERQTGRAVPLRVSVGQPARLRSGQQNRLMWDLIGVLAGHMAGRPATPAERMALYCDLLAEYGSEVTYLIAPAGAESTLKKAYRAVKIVENHPDGRVTFMAVSGSSTFTTAEMHDFIEHIFDRIAEEGAQDPRLSGWRQDWMRLQEKR